MQKLMDKDVLENLEMRKIDSSAPWGVPGAAALAAVWFQECGVPVLVSLEVPAKSVHKEIFAAIREAQRRFAKDHSDETFSEKLVGNRLKIASSLRKNFNLRDDDDFWGTLFNSMFESDAGLPGHPDSVPPLVVGPVDIVPE